jgi:hypothetical protein
LLLMTKAGHSGRIGNLDLELAMLSPFYLNWVAWAFSSVWVSLLSPILKSAAYKQYLS